MIKGNCRTNLDDYQRYTWPKVFVSVPLIGSSVQSKEGRKLKVAQITHFEEKISDYVYEPRIEVELGKF